MIVINLACGLANRMFQYSYWLYLRKKGYDAVVDFYKTAKLPHENVLWERIFPDARLHLAPERLAFKLGGGSDMISRIRRRFSVLNNVVIMPSAFDYFTPDNDKDKYVMGVFQNAGMVETVDREVRRAFRFSLFEDKCNMELSEEMSACNSVAVHVRKGNDYMQRKWYVNTCPVDYYMRAAEKMVQEVVNPHFFVFTDNPNWVKENLAWLDYTLVDQNPSYGWGSHFDMQLMTCCRHNIISNSTYSWWGAYLNGNSEKLVIAPSVWFSPGSCDEYTSGRVLCKGWIAL